MTAILAFSFNTQSNRLVESLSPDVVEGHRENGYLSLISPTAWRYSGSIPDFWTPLSEKIQQEHPMIIAIGFQEDVRPGSYFHSHLLPEQMTLLGYRLYDRTTLMGVGQTTATGLIQADPFVRGLRLSVYVHSEFKSHRGTSWPALSYAPSLFRNKGAVAIYVTLPNNEVLAIVNTHFPFDSQSLTTTVIKRDLMIRQNAVLAQDRFFNEAYRELILDAPARPAHVLFMGDLNYRIDPFMDWSARETGAILLRTLETSPEQYAELIDRHDELRQQLRKGNLYPMLEGIENKGPVFAPTCKMEQTRTPGLFRIWDYSLGKSDQRVPSHCDRILHLNLTCTEYSRFDHGVMAKSDHAGVIGVYYLE